LISIKLISYELNRLIEDYDKCRNFTIKEQIYSDIKLLSEALLLIRRST